MHFRSGRGFSTVPGLFDHAESEKLGGKISSGPEHAENRRFRRARNRKKMRRRISASEGRRDLILGSK